MNVELVGEDDQTAINFAVITEVILNTSSIVAQALSGAIPLQQQVNVCIFELSRKTLNFGISVPMAVGSC